MLLLPFLPITALIMQNATTLSTLLTYQVFMMFMIPLSDETAFSSGRLKGSERR